MPPSRAKPAVPWECLSLALLTLILLIRFPVHFLLEPPFQMDFEVYRAAALRLLTGQADVLYAPTHSTLALFKYAPLWALCWAPLGYVSSHLGGILWSMGSSVCLVLTVWVAGRLCRWYGLRTHALAPLLVAALMSRILNEEFANGQVDTLWGFLLVGGVYGIARHRLWLGALALSLAMSLKLPAGLFLVYLLVRRQWPLVLRIVGLTLAMNVLAAWAVSPQHPWALFGAWFDVLRSSGPSRAFEIGSQSLLALLSRYLTDDGYPLHLMNLSRDAVVVITLGVQLLLFGLLLARPGRRMEKTRWLMDSALLTIMVALFAPTCWLGTYTVMAFPCVVALSLVWTSPPRTARDAWSLGLFVAAVACSLFTHRKAWHAVGIHAIGNESYVFLVVMTLPWFALALLGYLWRQRQLGVTNTAA